MPKFFKPKINSLLFVLTTVILLVSCNPKQDKVKETPIPESTESVSTASTSQDEVLQAYIEIKNALIDSDASAAATGAEQFIDAVSKNPSKKEWKSMANTFAKNIQGNSDLELQRVAFEQLSDALIQYYSQNSTPENLYVQFCPMAFNNTGAYWISDSEEVLNPYFGDQMLRCGYVAATIQ